MKKKPKFSNNWIGLNALAREAGMSKTRVLGKIEILQRDAPEIHHRLVNTSNENTLYKYPDTTDFLRRDLRKNKLKTNLKKVKSSSQINKRIIKIDKETVAKGNELFSQPVEIEGEQTLNKIILETTNLEDRERLILIIKICNEYSLGFHTLAECTQEFGISIRKFERWRLSSSNYKLLFQKAKHRRYSLLKERDVEEGKDIVRQIARGSTEETEFEESKLVQDDNGNFQIVEKKTRKVKKKNAFNLGAAKILIESYNESRTLNSQSKDPDIENKKAAEKLERMSDEQIIEYLEKAKKILIDGNEDYKEESGSSDRGNTKEDQK